MFLNGYVILIMISVFLYLFWYLKNAYLFFENIGIPYIKPNFIFGNVIDIVLLRKSMAECYADLYRKLEPHKLGGIFIGVKPMIIIRDPNLVKNILIKDFSYFADRGFHADPKHEPMSNHIFFMNGDEWKHHRKMLAGIFTVAKMKLMVPFVCECGEKLHSIIDKTPLHKPLEVKDLFARYTSDVIESCVFGLKGSSLDNPNSDFRIVGKKIFKFRFQTLIRFLQLKIPQKVINLLNITLMDTKTQNVFRDIIYKTMDYREKNNVKRNDMLDLLMDLKNNKISSTPNEDKDLKNVANQVGGNIEDKSDIEISDQTLAAQALVFFLAGFETSSTNLTYVLLELAQNNDIQEKVRQEIRHVLSSNEGNINYDVLQQMTYTDMVIAETLRKYPPLAILQRTTLMNYKVPDLNVTIPAGTMIVISNYGLQNDEKYFDNPEEFRPERFSSDEEEKSRRPHFSYLPFGEGPRICIGLRFGKLSVKIGLIYALKDFSYRVSPDTKFPLEYDKNFGLLTPKNEVLLMREKIA